MEFLLNLLLFIGAQLCRHDFIGLETEQIKLLGVGLFIDDERSLLGFQGGPLAHQPGESLARRKQTSERVQ